MNRNKLVLFICAITLLIILIELVWQIKDGIQIMKLNNMYKDIKVLEDKISLYYLDNGSIPVVSDNIVCFYANSVNPNDNDVYYEIDLEKIENLSLSYGNKFLGEQDIYIINEQSHTIYYYLGVEYDNKKIYTRQLDYKLIEME